MTTELVLLAPSHIVALSSFLDGLGADDQTFLGADLSDPSATLAAARRWSEQGAGRYRAAVAEGGGVVGFVGVDRGAGWSSHVGRLRLVVGPGERGRGTGRALAVLAIRDALDLGLAKLVVEVRSDQSAIIGLFQSLGFQAEALLADHLRSPDGRLYDLVTLVHRADELEQLLGAIGAGAAG